jgi:hypothetical protein
LTNSLRPSSASNRASSNSVVTPDDGNMDGLPSTDWQAIVDFNPRSFDFEEPLEF